MKAETRDYLSRVVNGMIKVAGMVREDTVEAATSGDHIFLIHHFDEVRKATDTIKEARKALDEIEDNLSKQTVPDALRLVGVKHTYVEGIGRVGISNRFSCSMLDKDMGFQWLRDNGHDGLITLTVNSSSLSAFAKELIEGEGVELPPEIFKVGTQSYTSITKK